VGLHERARLGVDRGRQRAGEDALRELLELLLGDVPQPGSRRGDEAREAEAPELEACRAQHRVGQVAGAHPPARQPVAQERHRREAGDQGAVHVEEGAHRRPGGALVDLAGQVGVERHTKPSQKIPPRGAGGRDSAGFPPDSRLG